MNKQFDSALFQTARNTFENLAFMLSLEEGDAGPSPLSERRSVTVDFTGPLSGRLVVSISPPLMPELATSMLGLDGAEPSPTQQQDAFKELGNIICGNLLPAIAGTQAVFAVSAPILVADGDAPNSPAPTPTATANLTLENGAAELALYVNEKTDNQS